MMDVDGPQELRSQSVVIPSEGVVITSSLHLIGDVEISGEGPITLKDKGRIIVEKNSQVNLKNVSIQASGIKVAEDEASVYLIAVKPGASTSLVIDDSKFVVDIPYEKSELEAPWDQPPKFWVVGIPNVGADPVNAMNIVMRNSYFLNKQPYAAGALELLQNIPDDFSPILKGEVKGSEFHGFHGVIRANNLKGFSVSGNRLVKNSFANISVQGDNVMIENNKIYYPGSGTTGDGITAFGKFTNGVIDNNLIFVGSCYWVLVRGGGVNEISIKNNSIINGITSAILIDGPEGGARNVSVANNVIAGNHGFAVALSGVKDAVINNNHFSDNAKGFPSQVYLESSSNVVLKHNFIAPALTPEWARGLQLYRSHVKIDDTSFTFPRTQVSDGENYK